MTTTIRLLKKIRTREMGLPLSFALAIALGALPEARGVTAFWHGQGTTANWSDSANWDDDPTVDADIYTLANGDTLRWFPATVANKNNTNDLVGLSVVTVSFLNSGLGWVLNGNKLTWSDSIDGSNADSPVLNLPVEAGDNAVVIRADTGKIITLNGNITESVASTVIQFNGGTVNLNGSNSWTGVARLGGGASAILNINTLSNKSTPQSLGRGDIEFGYAAGGVEGGGAIVYTGGATTTDKGFQIGRNLNTFDSDPGNALINNGSGAIVWNGIQTKALTLVTSLIFTLGGTNTGDNDWQSVIDNNTTTRLIGITKIDSGKWILSGNNLYDGPTTVSNGTLLINGNQSGSTGNVTVASGAFLGGTGTIGGAVSASSGATLVPGSAGVGTLTITGAVTLAEGAGYAWQYQNGNGDLIDINSTLTLPNAATVTVSQISGNLPATLTLFTADALAGATDLSGWTVNGLAGAKAQIQGTSVTLKMGRQGTIITIR